MFSSNLLSALHFGESSGEICYEVCRIKEAMKFESQEYTSFIFICNKNSSHLALSIIVKLCLLQSDLPTLPGGCVVQVVPKMSIYSWCNMFSSRSDQGIEPKQFSQIKFTIIQTTHPMSRYHTRKTIVFLAAIISMMMCSP